MNARMQAGTRDPFMRFLRLIYALFGDAKKRRFSEAMVLTTEEVPGKGWTQIGSLSSRVGVIETRKSAMAARAHDAGTFTTGREFKQAKTSCRLRVRVRSYATAEDARAMIPEFVENFQDISDRYGKTNTIIRVDLAPEEFGPKSLISPNREFFEQSREKLRGRVLTRYIVAAVENEVYSVACTMPGGAYAWSQVLDIATLQEEKIQKVHGEGGES
jgi:hypothetical protein